MNSESPSESNVLFWRNAMYVSLGVTIIPPLLGLGGTVLGMIRNFNELSTGGMGDPEALAENISFSLITTAVGLVVAFLGLIGFVVCLIRYLILRKRYLAIAR